MTSEATGPLPIDRHYLAGFFDGEGSIGIVGSSLCCRVVNTYRPTLERFQAAYGGTVSLHRTGDAKARQTWLWRTYGDDAAAFLSDVIPLLREKAPQAYLGLHFRTLQSGDPGRDHVRTALSLLKRAVHLQ